MHKCAHLAIAVAAIAGSAPALAAGFEINDRTTLSIGGTLEPSFVSATDATGDSQSEFTDNDSELRFNGEHRWTERATGFFHIEYEWNFDEGGSGQGVDDLDSAWIGVKGDLGMVRAGTSDTLYEDEVTELLDAFENAELSDEADADDGSGEGNQIRYVSPDFGGFSVAAELKHEGDAEGTVAGESGTGIALAGRYDADTWGVVAGLDDRGAATQANPNTGAKEFVEETTAGVGGYFDLDAFHFAARFASESNSAANSDVEYAGVLGSYDYGDGSVNLGLQDVSPDSGPSRTEVAANVKHDLFDNLRGFVEIGRFDRPNDADDRVEIGAIYSF